MSNAAAVFVMLDDVDRRYEDAYIEWQSRVVLPALERESWARRVLTCRAVDELPGAIAKGEFYPRFLTLVVIDSLAAPADGELDRMASLGQSPGTHPMLRRSYIEFNIGQRTGGFLAESHPRTIFFIGQKVFRAKESEYNYWFDVDDESNRGTSRLPTSHYRERLSYPGFIRGTRMKLRELMEGDDDDQCLVPNYITLYEVTAPWALQTPEYTNAPQNRKSAGGGGMFRLLFRHTYLELPHRRTTSAGTPSDGSHQIQ
ncbi:MAG TPA: hypothetical protein VFA81_12390 [Burkholderiales bacterium]|nr:hypothetical protein [Burkholderiales bacterium]